MLKSQFEQAQIVGIVIDKFLIPKDENKLYGVYQYKIEWMEGTASKSGWSIPDITGGRLRYVEKLSTLKVLYGRKDV